MYLSRYSQIERTFLQMRAPQPVINVHRAFSMTTMSRLLLLTCLIRSVIGNIAECPAVPSCPANMTSLSFECVCAPGYEASPFGCISCLDGAVKAGAGNYTCTQCGASRASSSDHTRCLCPQVGDAVCVPCPGNSTTASPAALSIQECRCLPGFQGDPFEGCQPCPSNGQKYGLGPGPCVLDACYEGYWKQDGRCVPCPADFYCPHISETPIPCPDPNHVSPRFSTSPADCRCAENFTGSETCTPIPETYAPVCAMCPTSTVVMEEDNYRFCACAPGFEIARPVTQQNLTCTPCPRGFAKPEAGDFPCSPCSETQQSESGATQCTCRPNHYGSKICFPCPEFTISPVGSTRLGNCTCQPEYFMAGEGFDRKCERCPLPAHAEFTGIGCEFHCVNGSFFRGGECIMCGKTSIPRAYIARVGIQCRLLCLPGYRFEEGRCKTVKLHPGHDHSFYFDSSIESGRFFFRLWTTHPHTLMYHSNFTKHRLSTEPLNNPCRSHQGCLHRLGREYTTFFDLPLAQTSAERFSQAQLPLAVNISYSATEMMSLARCIGHECHMLFGAVMVQPTFSDAFITTVSEYRYTFHRNFQGAFGVITRHRHSSVQKIQGVTYEHFARFSIQLDPPSPIISLNFSIHTKSTDMHFHPHSGLTANQTVHVFDIPFESLPPFPEISIRFDVATPYSRAQFSLDPTQKMESGSFNVSALPPFKFQYSTGWHWHPTPVGPVFNVSAFDAPLAIRVLGSRPVTVSLFASAPHAIHSTDISSCKGCRAHIVEGVSLTSLTFHTVQCEQPLPKWFLDRNMQKLYHQTCHLGPMVYFWDHRPLFLHNSFYILDIRVKW